MQARDLMRGVFDGQRRTHERLALISLLTARALQLALAEAGGAPHTIYREPWSGAYDVTDRPCPALEHSVCTCTDCTLARDAAQWIDTMNFIGATADDDDDRVLVLLPAQFASPLDPEDAIRAAAWLVVAAELAGYHRASELAAALVERIKSI